MRFGKLRLVPWVGLYDELGRARFLQYDGAGSGFDWMYARGAEGDIVYLFGEFAGAFEFGPYAFPDRGPGLYGWDGYIIQMEVQP